ncbi:MAG: hypothetical protein ABSH48_21455 [Verrucomicrobiota bacterium]|jgi:hypothetical protein
MKKQLKQLISALALLALSALNPGLSTAEAQGTTAFTYQGQLRDGGTNANGIYTMIFALYDSAANGDQIGSAITNNLTLANGLFSVNLDFGAGAFDGGARWLDITITNGATTQELSPRVQVLPAPYAQFSALAATVMNGAITTAQLAPGAVADANIATNTSLAMSLAELNLGLIRGDINSGGSVDFGQGFSVTLTNNLSTEIATFTVSFSVPFAGSPAVTLGIHSASGAGTAGVESIAPNGFIVNNYHGTGNLNGFSFLAIGPK